MEIITAPGKKDLIKLCEKATRKLMIVSPWIQKPVLDLVLDQIKDKKLELRVLMRGDDADFLGKSSDIEVLNLLYGKADLRLAQDLHAKVYIADDDYAIITSANLTGPGFWIGREQGNAEVGVWIDEPDEMRVLVKIIGEWFTAGTVVDDAILQDVRYYYDTNIIRYKELQKSERQVSGVRRGKQVAQLRKIEQDVDQPAESALSATSQNSPEGVGDWQEEIREWARKHRHPELIEEFINFFGHVFSSFLSFKSFSFGADHNRRISLKAGGSLIAIINVPDGNVIELLVDDPSLPIGSYKTFPNAVKRKVSVGYLKCPWDDLHDLNNSDEVWASHAEAVRKWYYALKVNQQR